MAHKYYDAASVKTSLLGSGADQPGGLAPAFAGSRYPTPRTLSMTSGPSFRRSALTYTLTTFVPGSK